MTEQTKTLSRGAGWIYSYRWIDRLLAFVSVAILARILEPEDFGLVAIAASWVAIVEGLSEFDVNRALIQSRDEARELYDSAWTLSVLRGLVAAAAMLAVAPLVSDPRIGTILRVLAVVPVFQGLANPRFVLFERDLVYSRLAASVLGAKLVSFTLTIVVAIVYRSYWALVVGIFAESLVSSILTYVLKPWRPRPTLARSREILRFSGWMSLANIAMTLSMRTDRIIVGRFLGIADAGLYYMTQRIGVLPTSELISPLQRLLFPSFSQMTSDRVRLRRAARESINVLGSMSLPAAAGFALVAPDLVPAVLGERWRPIVPLLTVLVPYLGVRATLSMTQPCVMALGRTELLFRVTALYGLVHLPVFIGGVVLYGLEGAIWSIVLAGVLYWSLNAWLLRHTLGITLREIAGQLWRPLGAAGIMTALLLLATRTPALETFLSALGVWPRILALTATGALVYGAALWGLWVLQGRPAGVEHRILQLVSR